MDNDKLAEAVTKAIGYTENGGAPTEAVAGKSGELKSIFQYEPGTWKKDAQQFLGDANAPLTRDNETYVTLSQVKQWLKKGYEPEQIFSMWNAGIGEPDAYTGKFSNGESSTGTNKHGVKYSVPHYVNTGMKYLKEFSGSDTTNETTTPQIEGHSSTGANVASNAGQPDQQGGAVAALLPLIAKATQGGQPQGTTAPSANTSPGLLNPEPQAPTGKKRNINTGMLAS